MSDDNWSYPAIVDTDLSDHTGHEGLWVDYPNRTVPALPVVVYLYLLEHLPPHGIPDFETLTMDCLNLQAIEETHGIRVDAPIYVKSCILLTWGHVGGAGKPHA